MGPPATAVPSTESGDTFSLRPVRDADRLPSMLPALQSGLMSNPDSPTTPLPPRNPLNSRRPRRPSIRHQPSTSADDMDTVMEDAQALPDEQAGPAEGRDPSTHSQDASRDASPHGEPVDEDSTPTLRLTIPPEAEVDNVDIAQQTPT